MIQSNKSDPQRRHITNNPAVAQEEAILKDDLVDVGSTEGVKALPGSQNRNFSTLKGHFDETLLLVRCYD